MEASRDMEPILSGPRLLNVEGHTFGGLGNRKDIY